MLYKYCSEAYIDYFFRQKTIRFTQPGYFNDPFECSPVLKGIIDNLEVFCSENAQSIYEEEFKKLPDLERKIIVDNSYLKDLIIRNAVQSMPNSINTITPLIQKKLKEVLWETIGVVCFSREEKSELMWAHYGNSHRGFMVEFDENEPFLTLVKVIRTL